MNSMVVLALCFVISLIIGVPVVWALALSSMVACLSIPGVSLAFLAQKMELGSEKYALLAIFFFLLAGSIMQHGGIAKRLIAFAKSIMGAVRGGMSIVTIVTCMFFAALSGSSVATTASIGSILYPELVKDGYDKGYAAALPVVGGTLGIVIPPSVTFIVYGTTLNISVGKLLFSGVVPGILGSIALSVMCYIFAKKRNYPKGEKMNRKEFWKVAWEAGPALLTPLIILGGIYSGLFTPTESAAGATLYSIIATKFFYKELDWSIYKQAMRDTTQTTANIMILVMSATCFSWLLTVNNIPTMLSTFLLSIVHTKFAFWVGVLVLLVFLGMFMDVSTIILIIAPLLAPVADSFGIDPIQFGCIFVFTLAIGQATPPFGACLFVSSSISGHGIMRLGLLSIPFVLVLLLVVILTCIFPDLATLLPSLMAA